MSIVAIDQQTEAPPVWLTAAHNEVELRTLLGRAVEREFQQRQRLVPEFLSAEEFSRRQAVANAGVVTFHLRSVQDALHMLVVDAGPLGVASYALAGPVSLLASVGAPVRVSTPSEEVQLELRLVDLALRVFELQSSGEYARVRLAKTLWTLRRYAALCRAQGHVPVTGPKNVCAGDRLCVLIAMESGPGLLDCLVEHIRFASDGACEIEGRDDRTEATVTLRAQGSFGFPAFLLPGAR